MLKASQIGESRLGRSDECVAFRVLGPLECAGRSGKAQIDGVKQRLVIAQLLLNANRTVSVDSFTLCVWDDTPQSIRSNLRTYVSHLRKSFAAAGIPPDRLATDAGGYRIDVEPDELDLRRFDILADAGQRALVRGETALAVSRFDTALGLWRGEPLDGLPAGPHLDAELLRLRERRMLVRQWWADAALAAERHEEVAVEIAGLVRAEPLREGLWVRLMLALYRSGRQGEARGAYRQLCELLDHELSARPGCQARELYTMIMNADPRLAGPSLMPRQAAAP